MFLLVVGYLWVVRRQRREAVRVIVSVAAAGIFSVILKELFDLPRPFEEHDTEALAGLALGGGFPSFHTALAFALATNVTFHQKHVGVLLLIAAGLVGIGRIFAEVHYPVDILFGIVIGIAIAVLVESLYIPTVRPRKK